MHILDQIIEAKKKEVANQKLTVPEAQLKQYPAFGRICNSLKQNLIRADSSGIIAEFKQKSPSKGMINEKAEVEEVTRAYARAGAAGISVLTDSEFFGGSLENLVKAREANPDIPILRKDFIIDPYQVTQAKAHGADLILLIAACLEKQEAELLAQKAKDLGMEVLMEFHHAGELEKLNSMIDLAGVNNRNLKTFELDVETSVKLAELIPQNFIKVSESGLNDYRVIRRLRKIGYNGFLIGETFMKTDDPGKACAEFILEL